MMVVVVGVEDGEQASHLVRERRGNVSVFQWVLVQAAPSDDWQLTKRRTPPGQARTCVMLKRHGTAAEHCVMLVVLPCSGGVKCPAEVMPYQSAHGSSLTMSFRSPSRRAPTAEPE